MDFDHVIFSYRQGKGKPVLQDIDLHIEAGQTIGILGGTGSAKSSLVNLISRLYDVSEGSVRVGGHDVREYDLTTLRDEVAVVLRHDPGKPPLGQRGGHAGGVRACLPSCLRGRFHSSHAAGL